MTTQNKPDKKCKLWFHDWSEWELKSAEKFRYGEKPIVIDVQIRRCKRCGYTKVEAL